ncbi:IclR family transcriptional regulator [Aeromicrobium sp.]|uniref:IclR family transcriptional regulator n=1 Tax=Aeromicrobium sp. TaxID=1871063 RepID=UPI0030BA35FF
MEEQGPQVVSRVGALLRTLGECEPDGASTTVIARLSGLARPTVHRLLTSLVGEGLAERSSETGRWFLGPELYLLGTMAAERYDVTDLARQTVALLAKETGESAFFSARRGDQTVCLLREDGSFPLRSHVLYEGIRLPLGVASAGLVILAHRSDREIDGFFERVDLTTAWGVSHSESAVRGRIAETRTTGFAVNPGLLVEGSWGIGAAVFDRHGSPEWALSLTGVESRFRPDRLPGLGARLLDQAHALSRLLA